MRAGDIRPPSSAVPTGTEGECGFIVPACFVAPGGMKQWSFTGYVVAHGDDLIDMVAMADRGSAKTYAEGATGQKWKTMKAGGWDVVPVRILATRIDA